jgi:cytochrome c biogenesis protein CcdA
MAYDEAMLLFVSGICNAFGPCNAQRILVLLACTDRRAAPMASIAFASGIVFASVLLVASASLVQQVLSSYCVLNACLAILCLVIGVVGLWRADARSCEHLRLPDEVLTPWRAWGLGFGSSLVIAPCCAPFFVMIAANTHALPLPLDALAYGLGNALPYCIGGIALRAVLKRLVGVGFRQALAIATSTLTLAIGFLYCLEI